MFLLPFIVGGLAGGAAVAAGLSAMSALAIGGIFMSLTQMLVGGEAKQKPPRPDELDESSVTEAAPVPIVFGRLRLPSNVIRMDRDTFITEALKTKVKTGMFSSKKVTTGYNYYITQDVGICCGQIDRVRKVLSNPGEHVMWTGERAEGDYLVSAIDYTFYNGSYMTVRTKDLQFFRVGQSVQIAGVSPTWYNGTFTISSINGDRDFRINADLDVPEDNNTNLYRAYFLRGRGGNITSIDREIGYTSFKVSGGRQDDRKGGAMQLYFGSELQERAPGNRYGGAVTNHRGICFAHMPKYLMGSSPRPGSIMFEIDRLPKPIDENLALIPESEFPRRGSNNPSHPAYVEANPAACIYEIMTNRTWGRGLNASKIDVEAFKSAANHFAEQNVGVSFSLGRQTAMADSVEMMRDHCQLYTFTKGALITCRAMTDRTTAYDPMITLTRDMLVDIKLTRPAWAGTVNELRAKFINRQKNFMKEVVSATDNASIQMAGTINSREVNLLAFSNRKTAEKQVQRLLSESSYPAANLTATMTRFNADLEPGDFVQLVIDDFAGGQPTTSYWRVIEINDENQDPEGIEITLHEDYYATSFVGYPDVDFITPTPSYEIRDTLEDDDLNFADDFSDLTDPGEIASFDIIDMPKPLSEGNAFALMALSAETENLYRVDINNRLVDAIEWNELLTDVMPQAYKMTLDAALDKSPLVILREQAIAFTVANAWQRSKIAEVANRTEFLSDDFAYLTSTLESLIFINDEVIQVGYAIETATGIEMKAFMRGAYGTTVQDHNAASVAYFFPNIGAGENLLDLETFPANTDVEMQFLRKSIRGDWGYSTLEPTVNIGTAYQQPMEMTLAQIDKNVGEWEVRIRPRHFTQQQNTLSLQYLFDERVVANYMGVRVQVKLGSSTLSDQTLGTEYFTGSTPTTGVAEYQWFPQDDNDPKSGTLRLKVLGVTGSRYLNIFTTDATNGSQSKRPLIVT